MATLVWSTGRNEELKHLLEFLRIRAMIMLTTGLLGLCLLCSLQSGIYCVWNISSPPFSSSITVCVTQELWDLPSIFPPEQDCSF